MAIIDIDRFTIPDPQLFVFLFALVPPPWLSVPFISLSGNVEHRATSYCMILGMRGS
jgi:hypothetical protein